MRTALWMSGAEDGAEDGGAGVCDDDILGTVSRTPDAGATDGAVSAGRRGNRRRNERRVTGRKAVRRSMGVAAGGHRRDGELRRRGNAAGHCAERGTS